jgi:hypothetical protein
MKKTKSDLVKLIEKSFKSLKVKFSLQEETKEFVKFVLYTKPVLSFIKVDFSNDFYILKLSTEPTPLPQSNPEFDLYHGMLYYYYKSYQTLDELIIDLEDEIGGLFYELKKTKKIFDKIYNRMNYLMFIFEEEGFELDDLLTINYSRFNSLK